MTTLSPSKSKSSIQNKVEDSLYARLQANGLENPKATIGYRTRSLLGSNLRNRRTSRSTMRNRRTAASIQKIKW